MNALLFVLALLSCLSIAESLAAKKSAMSRSVFLKKLGKVSKENFATDFMNSATEQYILNEAGSRIYDTYRKRIQRKGKELGVSVPSAWARKPFPEKEEATAEEATAEEAAVK